MDIYNDYINFINEYEDFLYDLKDNDLNILLFFNDCINVMDYLSKKHLDGNTLEMEEDEVFDIGYGYLSNSLYDLKYYYEEIFKKDIKMMKKYDDLLIYHFTLDDIKGYLISNDQFDSEKESIFNDCEDLIEDYISNHKEVTNDILFKLQSYSEEILPKKNDFQPAYVVFGLMADELDLF